MLSWSLPRALLSIGRNSTRPFVRSLRLLDLPTYAFDLKTFWRPYTTATASANGISMDHVGLQSPTFVPTATIQKIGHRKASSQRIEVAFVSSLSDSRLRDAIKGHSIEGVGICPASMYVDMAFTAAAYVHRTVWPEEKSLGTLKRLELNSPLVLREDSERQTVEVRVVAEEKDSWKANVSFYSQTGDGQFEQHGSCQVLDSSETIEAAQEDMITQARIRSALMMHTNDHSDAQIDHLHRRMFYKLYGTVVKYDSRYQGIAEAFVKETPETPGTIEAVAEVKLTATPDGERGAFMVNPYYSDSLVHIGGFALNTKLSDDDEDVLYFSSGIGSITLLHEIDEKTTYRSYLWASVNPEGDSEASVYILNENELVGAVTGLTFRRIKREFLKALLQQAQSNGEAPTAAQSRETSAQPNSKGPSSIAEAVVPRPTRGHGKMADAFISAVVAETGINQEDIEDSTKLSELGVDSLMGMAIIRRVKADTGQILPVSMLSELQTVRDVRERLDPCPHKSEGRSVDLVTRYKSNAVLLQGHANSPNRPLFFVAGSGGSASIYAQLPNLASDTPIWVLESPFLNLPSEMNYSPQEIAPIYVAAVKAIRPTGPYLLGGYSAGAVHAYEIARLMLDGGDDVDKLILVDMKAHRPGETWEEAPRMEDVEMLYDFLQVGDNAPATASPGTHREQLEREGRFASLRCMYNWKPTPMDPSRRPKNGTVMIWARWGVRQYSSREERGPGFYVNPMAAENRDYKSWFTAPRHTFDANGWDILVGDIQTHVVFGDHWSMLQRPFAAELSTLIDQALTSRRNNKVEHNEQDR
ncbi:hypothetical protein NUW58_g5471 [Xylaria curta]|uniref:Uncharacterized protein n=1 Tax=Xylaria curta TaxID=42375 RepID=A0ACC1P2W9_9PEZI|nr:hypothetical protein NUW58_g5471 [Xylaria curta]